jgi:GNAT superfamily N-acetyltransferase
MISIRTATFDDVTRLVALNHAAYPDLVGEGIVFEPEQIRAQLARFPEGQLVAVVDGEIVGAIATLVLPASLALAPHTWADATADGTFRNHDPHGDCLYLADVYVAPTAWGRGVGAALYRALFALCRTKQLARVVAGGRLFGYHEVRDRMTPVAYVDEVMRGVRRDQVLGSQLRAGFVVHGVMRDYLHDWRSASFATLLAWPNPDLRVADERAPRLVAET